MKNTSTYEYFKSSESISRKSKFDNEKILQFARNKLYPSLKNPDYLVLNHRRKLISAYIEKLMLKDPIVLDIGGRIPTYRTLLGDNPRQYISIDPIFNSVTDVIGIGENLPFRNHVIDLIICTQVLSYVKYPYKVIEEIYRVLNPEGALILSIPSFFPKHHDERWRFLPEGIELLLSSFSKIYIEPEGHSFCGFFRTANVCLNSLSANKILDAIIHRIIIPANNLAGAMLDRFNRSEFITPNYTVLAIK